MSVAERITLRLQALGKNPSEVAKEAGLGLSAVRDILKGKAANPRIDTIRKLTHPLECSMGWLLGEETVQGDPLEISTDTAASRPSASPELVLRIVLAANPSADEVLAALEAGGFKVVPIGANAGDNAIDDPAAFVNEILRRRSMSPSALAKACGLAHTTVSRGLGLDPKYNNIFNARTLKIIKEWDRSQGGEP
ncbi:MAG: hypothetical protein JWR80_10049 [Bradyrhizobium sp.]|nr:hypothetical protein [Bradyrhizobium sp.]